MIQGLRDGLVCQGLKAVLELQAGQEGQGLLGTLESKASLVQGDILDIVEIWEIQGLGDNRVSQGCQDFLEPKVSQDSLLDSLVHLDPKDCQVTMDRVHPEGVQEIQGTQDPGEGLDSRGNQALSGNQEDKEDQAPQGLWAHQVAQVFQVFQVIMVFLDNQAPLAHMGLQGPLDHRVWMDWMGLEVQKG